MKPKKETNQRAAIKRQEIIETKPETSQSPVGVSKKPIYFVAIGLGILIVLFLWRANFSAFKFGRSTNSAADASPAAGAEFIAGSPEKFAFLSGQTGQRSVVNNCGLSPASVETMPDEARIQGACCQAIDLQRYQVQVQELKQYANFPQIPSDPYDVPVSLVKQNLEYDKTIQLTADQQAVYDQASQMADDKGPCCCKCWRWYSNEGQAKYFISQLHWSAQQVAAAWDAEEGCGGPGDSPSNTPMPTMP